MPCALPTLDEIDELRQNKRTCSILFQAIFIAVSGFIIHKHSFGISDTLIGVLLRGNKYEVTIKARN